MAWMGEGLQTVDELKDSCLIDQWDIEEGEDKDAGMM